MTSFLDLLKEDRKITFLLGAGSSVSAGFPTDTELRNKVAEYMLNENVIKLFVEAGFSKESCQEFRARLIRGGYSTIDELINSFTQYAPLGKMAILKCILSYESLSDTDSFYGDNHWYMPFFLTIQKEGLIDKLGNITFVTLNYDRSLQHFLHEFSSYRGITQKPKILHLHGRLPPLKFEIEEGQASLPYGDYSLDGPSLNSHASGISSLADIRDDNEHYEQAKAIIYKSNYLFIMGFGFHKIILEKLNLTNTLPRHLKVYSLSYGLKKAILDDYPEINFYDDSMKCTEFVKQMGVDLDSDVTRYGASKKASIYYPRSYGDDDIFSQNHYNPFD